MFARVAVKCYIGDSQIPCEVYDWESHDQPLLAFEVFEVVFNSGHCPG